MCTYYSTLDFVLEKWSYLTHWKADMDFLFYFILFFVVVDVVNMDFCKRMFESHSGCLYVVGFICRGNETHTAS